MLDHINHWGFALVLCVCCHLLITNQAPDLVDVDCGAHFTVLDDVEVAHTDFSKETWVVLVPHDPVVMLTSCITATTWMLPVLSNTTMSCINLTTMPTILLKAGSHCLLLFTLYL